MSKPAVRITSIKFENFKALKQFHLSLDQINILVGQNNSGKSTIISAFRALNIAVRFAKNKKPSRIIHDGISYIGYIIPESSIPISMENVHTNYNSIPSLVAFNLSNKNTIKLLFPVDGGCILICELNGSIITSAAEFKRNFPISLNIVPVLGPLENREKLREKPTVIENIETHRAARNFRNYWYYFPDNFSEFSNKIKDTWNGMEIEKPELNFSTGEFSMFVKEERVARELYWVGFGFQVWCQLLTHISRSNENSLIVMDEPETYLHPDIQRQLINIIREIKSDVIIATHASEIMAECDPSEIVMIDKNKKSGERLKDISGVQKALDKIGSAQNITLTALARSRRVVFVEGDSDFRIIRRFARRVGLRELGAGAGLIGLPSEGFSSWQRVSVLASGIASALGAPLSIAAIYDRDFFCAEHIDEVRSKLSENLTFSHVHERKEIENYLLIIPAIDRAVRRAIDERVNRKNMNPTEAPNIEEVLKNITEKMQENICAQFISKRIEYHKRSRINTSDITSEAIKIFNYNWSTLEGRLKISPGKEVLGLLRVYLQEKFGISLTEAKIIESMHLEEIPKDLTDMLDSLEYFRNSPTPNEKNP
ncbi:ATP-dependent endonuclease [Pseudoroseomonas cervicalis]|uniref:ATP-dependent nuclease n=1 Tax=Teichococcus cervicalis TaxID=204525 RepID=UPI0022F179BD|nr:AAA family ATPase [Pseudoroseomonas cervicalis]WBV43790.1 AAA family ATPase [Pseudoroseomonas cervicalis]